MALAGADQATAAHGDAADELQIGQIDARFTDVEYRQMLDEVRDYLPAFLSPAASEHHDPVGDVKELLRLGDEDLARVLAVHVCLSDEVSRFANQLAQGLRRPLTSTERPLELTQAVRGPIDWGATTRQRSLSGWDPSLYVIRPGQRIFNTPENQALAWALGRLEAAASRAARVWRQREDGPASGWPGRLEALGVALRRARRVEWLRAVEPKRPTARIRQRLAAARVAFYRRRVGDVVALLVRLENPDAATLTDVLCRRYFEPHRAWKLFEILVALRLAREIADPRYETTLRRARLLAGGEGGAYARYGLANGGDVALTYQGWQAHNAESLRQRTARRHGFNPQPSIPDLFVTRTDSGGSLIDAVVVELKATKSPGYLGEGLSQLLSYLGDRPQLFSRRPYGWLVAPASDVFVAAAEDADDPLWVVSADDVAGAIAARLTR
jgi:hypothetical protein